MSKAMTLALALCVLGVAGCGPEKVVQEGPKAHVGGLPDSVVAKSEPSGAKEVAEVKSTAKEGDMVVVRGVVGGDEKPIVAGRAVFTIGDVKGLKTCHGDDMGCKTPWDACCMTPDAKAANMLTVQFLGADGKPFAVDVAGSGIKPMSTVVVSGKVGPRPDPKVLVVDATSVYVSNP